MMKLADTYCVFAVRLLPRQEHWYGAYESLPVKDVYNTSDDADIFRAAMLQARTHLRGHLSHFHPYINEFPMD